MDSNDRTWKQASWQEAAMRIFFGNRVKPFVAIFLAALSLSLSKQRVGLFILVKIAYRILEMRWSKYEKIFLRIVLKILLLSFSPFPHSSTVINYKSFIYLFIFI